MAAIDILPTELLRIILLYFRLQSHAKRIVIQLSHVCRRWRDVIVSTSDFWTFVTINFSLGTAHQQSRLDTLLQRTGNLHIDVKCTITATKDLDCSWILASIAKYVPFNRWRSLDMNGLEWLSLYNFKPEALDKCGGFEALISLTTLGTIPFTLMQAIDNTAHALSRFHVGGSRGQSQIFPEHSKALFNRVTQLSIPAAAFRKLEQEDYSLPPNITHLTAISLSYITRALPHVTHLITGELSLATFTPSIFPGLKFLHGQVRGYQTQQVLLRSLQELIIDVFDSDIPICRLSAPELETLRIHCYTTSEMAAKSLRYAIYDPGYQLSPTTLYLDGLKPTVIVAFLVVSTQTRYLTFTKSAKARMSGQEWRIVVDTLTKEENGVWRYCPCLVKIHVSLQWARPEEDVWLEYAEEIVHARNGGPMQSITLDWLCGGQVVIPTQKA